LKTKRSILLIDQVFLSGSQLILMLTAAKIMGIDKFGEFSYLWLLLLLGQMISQSTIMATLNIVSQNKEGNPYLYVGIINLSFVVVFCFLLYFFSSTGIGQLGKIDDKILISFIFFTFSHLIFWYFRRTRIIAANFLLIFFTDVFVFGSRVIFVLVPFFIDNISYLFFAYGSLNIIAIFVLSSFLRFEFNKGQFLLVIKRFYNISIWNFPAATAEWTNSNFLVIIVAETHGLAAVGVLRLAQTFMGVSNVLLQYFDNVIPISAAKGYVKNGAGWLDNYIKISIKKVALSIIVLGSLGAIASLFIILNFYDSGYSDAVILSFLYVAVYFVVGVKYVYDCGLKTIERTRPIFLGNIFGLFCTITVGLGIIFFFGVFGVVISMFISQGISMLTQRIYFYKELNNAK
jgi:O-antigen/teichoic acid export membrane protein